MSVEWLVPWHPLENDSDRWGLVAELRRELRRDHVLAGLEVVPIARRQDNDDVLFSLADGRVAVVHLTWTGKTEPVADFPWTTFFDSLEAFVEEDMKPEHQQRGTP